MSARYASMEYDAPFANPATMSLPDPVSRSLRHAIAGDAGEYLVSWMEEMDSRRQEALQLRVEFAEFREMMRADMGELRQEMTAFRVEMREEMRQQFPLVHQGIRDVEARLRGEIKDVKVDILKWSFVFWFTALGSIGLARLLWGG